MQTLGNQILGEHFQKGKKNVIFIKAKQAVVLVEVIE